VDIIGRGLFEVRIIIRRECVRLVRCCLFPAINGSQKAGLFGRRCVSVIMHRRCRFWIQFVCQQVWLFYPVTINRLSEKAFLKRNDKRNKKYWPPGDLRPLPWAQYMPKRVWRLLLAHCFCLTWHANSRFAWLNFVALSSFHTTSYVLFSVILQGVS